MDRYPLLDEFGIFIAEIRVLTTTETIPVRINDQVYRWYPKIDFEAPLDKIATLFIDSVQFSNSYLPGLDEPFIPSSINLFNCWELLSGLQYQSVIICRIETISSQAFLGRFNDYPLGEYTTSLWWWKRFAPYGILL